MKRSLLALVFCTLVSCLPARAGEGKTALPNGQIDREYVLAQTTVPVYSYRISRTFPHDIGSYTEGLVIDDGVLYEGTGRYGRSHLYRGDLVSGSHTKTHSLGDRFFGEGITVMGDKVYQLTYKSNVGFIYDKKTFEKLGDFSYVTQGWGITHDEDELIMSNGSASLVFFDPATMQPTREVVVTDARGPLGFLNELEYVEGQLYANIWQTDLVARIDPESGKVTGWIDLTGLNPDPDLFVYPFVLNGIAHNPENGKLLVTGKCWPHIWEIDLVPLNSAR